jgi:glutathione S-transferase
MLKVLGKASSINVRKVLWVCDELGLAYEREDWGTGFRDTSEAEFVQLNPNALVPVLIDGDFVLWESNTILRYLASAHGGDALYPADGRRRAIIEQWMDWQATEFNNSWRYAFQALARKNPTYVDPVALQASIRDWSCNMALLDRQLIATDGCVAGDAFTLADIPIGLSVNRWFMTDMQRPELPGIRRYYERLSERPSYLRHGRNGIV